MSKRLRIFLSSPGDVRAAREIAALTMERLAQDYARFFRIEAYLWEYEAMVGTGHFQDSIEPPSAFDIVVLIVWSRLGTPLPERTDVRQYRGIDGRTPVTGTEWEFEEALKAAKETGVPDLLVYRSRQKASIESWDAETRRRDFEQLEALDRFWERHFANKGIFLGAYTEFTSNAEFAAALEDHLRKLIERRIAATPARTSEPAAKVWAHAPFRGLEAYEFEQAPIFFGQDEALAKAMLQLAANAESGSPFLLVLGASGTGKSSLVKAAVVPKLFVPRRIVGVSFLRRVEFRPSDARDGEGLFEALARRLTTPGGEWEGLPELLGPGQTVTGLAAHLRTATSEPAYPIGTVLGQLAVHARQEGRMLEYENPKLVLVVDQLEELFTSENISSAERQRFIELLTGFLHSGLVWVIATMRKDFWHRADETPELVRLAEGTGRLELLPPSPVQLGQIIRRPAEAADVGFEVHPVTNIPLNEVIGEEVSHAPGALPLLSYLMDQLYRADVLEAGSGSLTYKTYERLGRLEGAIATKAEAVMEQCPAEVRQSLGRVLFALVQMSASEGDIERAVARRVPLATFAPSTAERRLVDALLDPDARLLVSDAEKEGSPTVRLAHEALITRWDRARDFVRGNAEALKIRKRMEERYLLWRQVREERGGPARHARQGMDWIHLAYEAVQTRLGGEPGLLTDVDLADGVHLLREHREETEEHLREFIERSEAADQRIRSRSVRIMAGVTVIVALLAVFASIAGFLAQRREREAEYERDRVLRAQTGLLVDAAGQALRDNDVRTAENISLQVLSDKARPGPPGPALISAFEEARARDFQIAVLSGHRGAVWAAAFSPDGNRIATASEDGTLRIWDAATGVELKALTNAQGGLRSAAWSVNGSRIVAGTSSNTAKVWDVESGKLLGDLNGHTGPVNSAEFSKDGSSIVTGSDDGTARIWDAATMKERRALTGHGGAVLSVAFSPDGRRVVTASADKTARIWDANTGKQLTVLSGHTERVWSAAYSPDGTRVVTGSQDKTARVWDAAKGAQVTLLYGSLGSVHGVAFSPDGKRIVTASFDRVARIWDAASGEQLHVLSGHMGRVMTAEYSASSNRIVTASDDMTARVWGAVPENLEGVLAGHTAIVSSACFSPDGMHVATASSDRTVRIWDARTFREVGRLAGHAGHIDSVRYSPDGKRIITASYDKTVRVWDATTLKQVGVLDKHKDMVTGAVYSPDGRYIASSSFDKSARVWDAATLEQVAVLTGHSDVVRSVAFSPDGTRVVTASDDGTARIWNRADGREILKLSGHTAGVRSARYSPDGTRIVTSSEDRTARVWDAASGSLLLILEGHSYALRDAEYSPDGRYIVTAAYDRTARIWDAKTGIQLEVLPAHGDGMRSASYAPDGKHVVVASLDWTATVWNAGPPASFATQVEWFAAAQSDPLTSAEHSRFGVESRQGAASAAGAGKGATDAQVLARRGGEEELEALSAPQPRRNELLLSALNKYAAAYALAEKEGVDNQERDHWRYRRSSLARVLERAGMMEAVAGSLRASAR